MATDRRARVRIQEYDTAAEVWKTVETVLGATYPQARRDAMKRREALSAEHVGSFFRIKNSPIPTIDTVRGR